jgi:hypothetical protein
MPLYRDQVPRVTLAVLRARFSRRAFAMLKTVRLEHNGYVAEVTLIKLDEPGLPSGWRTWMQCARCSRPAEVIGCIPAGFGVEPGFACRRCGGWRGRTQRHQSEVH